MNTHAEIGRPAVGELVARRGLRLREDLGADDHRRRYLGGDTLPGYQFYRVAIADAPAPPAPAQARDA